MGFFSSFFSGKPSDPEAEKQKQLQKNFEIFKYDGLRAQRMGRPDYAVKCFTEALALKEDFETRSYLAQVLIQTGDTENGRKQLELMAQAEPERADVHTALANVCFMLEDYLAMAEAAQKAIALEAGNATAHYLLAKADRGQGDSLMCIAHLTQAVSLKEDFAEARLLRAEVLTEMCQYKEAAEDLDAVLAQNADEENALLLQARIAEATGNDGQAEAVYRQVLEANPFSEQAYLRLAAFFTDRNRPDESIALLDEAVDMKPDFAQAYRERGRAKLQKGDESGSLADVKRALELDPKEAERISGQFDNQPLVRETNVLGL